MKKFEIKKNGMVLAETYVFLENFENKKKESIIRELLNEVEAEKAGYSGYKSIVELKEFIEWAVFARETAQEFSFKISKEHEESIKKACNNAINLCSKFIEQKINIVIFPIFDSFVIEEMRGCVGFCTSPKNIIIAMNFNKNSEVALKETLAHELAHAISPFYNGGDFSLSEGFILDGLAEHFREQIIGGEIAPWSRAITKEKAKAIFPKLRGNFKTKELSIWESIFFGSEEYTRWSGYSIGYYLFEDYLKKQKKIDWKKIICTKPSIIFNIVAQDWNLKL